MTKYHVVQNGRILSTHMDRDHAEAAVKTRWKRLEGCALRPVGKKPKPPPEETPSGETVPRGRGRPKSANPATSTLNIRVRREDKARWQAAAGERDLSGIAKELLDAWCDEMARATK
jgi:hypothetical protein